MPKKLDYVFMPFYSFQQAGLKGYGKISYNITPFQSVLRKATISVEGTQFGAPGNQNYQQSKAGVELFFRPREAKSPFSQTAFASYISASNLAQINLSQKAEIVDFLQLGYELEKSSVVDPYRFQTTFEGNGSFQKVTAELNYRFSYYGKNNGLDIRLFAGGMLKTNASAPYYSLAPSGRSGRELYLYQGDSPDRFGAYGSSFWTRQMTLSEGGLISPINEQLGYSKALVSLSMTSDLPGKIGSLGIKPFVNVLWNDHGLETGNRSPIFFETGLKVGVSDLFEFSVPLLVSGNIQSMTGAMKDRIRFTFNLGNFGKLKSNLASMGI
jgi:hypothetical protein